MAQRSLLRILLLLTLLVAAAGCEKPIHTAQPLLRPGELVSTDPLVGTYRIMPPAAQLEDGAESNPLQAPMIAHVWPAQEDLHFVEWYGLGSSNSRPNGLALPLLLQFGQLPDGRLLAQFVHEQEYYPALADLDGESLRFFEIENDRNEQIKQAELLGLALQRDGLLKAPDRGTALRLLDRLATGRMIEIQPVPEAEYRQHAEVARLDHLFHLDRTWRDSLGPERSPAPRGNIAAVEILHDLGDAWATYMLARMHANGFYVEQDVERGRDLAEAALAAGEERAAALLGYLARQGLGRDADPMEARALLRRAAAAGEPNALRNLGLLELESPDGAEAGLQLLRQAADLGDPVAAEQLGQRYLEGNAVAQDDSRALAYLRLGAAGALNYSSYWAGRLHAEGRGVAPDLEAAARFYQQAANRGDPWSQAELAALHWSGSGVEQDRAKAATWYRRSAEQGNVGAMRWLGHALASGEGVPQDDAAAVGWFRKAAEAGDAFSKWRLGVHLAEGRGLPRDRQAAAELWRAAIAEGETRAQADLDALLAQVGEGEGAWARVDREDRQAKINQELLASCDRLRELCGGRICIDLDDGRSLYNTADGAYWYFDDGRLAPRDLWRDYSSCYQ